LVTTAAARGLDVDLPILGAALERAGTQFHLCDWDDPVVDWSSYDAVFLRSPWDYPVRRTEFVDWLRSVDRLTRLFNPVDVVTWNIDKAYLAELSLAGVPVIDTRFVDVVDASALRDVLDELGNDIVVKPSVSNGANNAARYRDAASDLDEVARHVARIATTGSTAMVQAYQTGIDASGETGIVWLNGEFSHAFRKGPILHEEPDMGNGLFAAEDITARRPSAAEMAVGEQVMAFLRQKFGVAPLYARVDVIPDSSGVPQMMELELVEPSMFLACAPGADDRVADAFLRARG
jgi:hypothetical protein